MRLVKNEDGLFLQYRLYYRKDSSSFKTYVAQIVGPHPNYYLQRAFLMRSCVCSQLFCTYTYPMENGVFEHVVKRFGTAGALVAKERKWLVVFDGRLYEYPEEDMNYLYVLYTACMLRMQTLAAA